MYKIKMTLRIIFLIMCFLSSCSEKKDDFISLKNDFENIFVEYRDTNLGYTKEELLKIRSDMIKFLKKEGAK